PQDNPKIRSPVGHTRAFFFRRRAAAASRPLRPRGDSPMGEEQAGEPPAELLAAAELLPALYAELRHLAGALSARLPPGHPLQPPAVAQEPYLKGVRDQAPGGGGGGPFWGAAPQAMREILIAQARRKASVKHGGHGQRIELTEGLALIEPPADDLLALDEAIQRLQGEEPRLGEIVQLRFYAGLSLEETASVVGRSVRTIPREWR